LAWAQVSFLVLVKERCILNLSERSQVVERMAVGDSEWERGASGFLLLIGVPSHVCARPTWMVMRPNSQAWTLDYSRAA